MQVFDFSQQQQQPSQVAPSQAATGSGPLTFTYKTTNQGLQIPLDVYLPTGVSAQRPARPLIWIHTGGFLQGTRKCIPPHFVRAVESAHLALIAIDFRLCPQVTLPELLDDVHDSITFVLGGALGQALGAAGLASNILDTSRWGISGSSAGGWSALLAGLAPRVPTPPSVIVAIYPITDVTRTGGDFFYTPLCPLPWAPPAASEIQRIVPRELVAAYLDKSAPPSSESPPATNPERAQLYNWARQEGCYPSLVLPSNSTGEEFSVASLLRARTSAPPPIFVVYGSGDVKVPFSQSEAVLAALKEKGFEHGALVREGLDHLYDMAPEYEERELWAYVAKYLNA